MNYFKKKLQKLIYKESKKNGKNGTAQKYLDYRTLSVAIFVLVVVLVSLMLPKGRSYKYTDLQEGEVYIGEEIIAPFTFAINKSDDEYKNDLRKAEESVLPIFQRNNGICAEQVKRIETFFDSLIAIDNENSEKSQIAKRITDLLKQYRISSSDEIILHLITELNNQTLQSFEDNLIRLARDICSVGMLNAKKNEIQTVDNKILIMSEVEEIVDEVTEFYDENELDNVLVNKLRNNFVSDDLRVKAGYEILKVLLKPNIIYDKNETQKRIREVKKNVPLAKGTVLANERIIDRYERVTKDHIAKLNSLAIEMAERESEKSIFIVIFRFLSKFLLIGLIISVFVTYLVFSRPEILKDLKRILLLGLIVLIVSFFAYIVNVFGLSPYLIPIAIGSMLIAIFFDTTTAIVGTVVISLLIGGLRGNEFNITAISIFVGTVSVISVWRVKTRGWLVYSIAMIVGAYILSITVFEVLHYTTFKQILRYWFFGLINGFLTPLFCYGLQAIFENVFDIVTDMRLLELSDLNQPILKKLSFEAPGTYHHSLMVGNFAEAAAESIGANALLARVGSYYHDIGKIEKPEYFIENQSKSRNPHEKLSPTMSCLILINHVKRGLDLAKKYKLPKEIRDFIAEHHGTNMMTFFHQKAIEKGRKENVDESSFRYPGPKPSTKETGIVMLSDAIEAAARTLKEPSASRIKGLVTSIVLERFKSSELDRSPLTLRDLTHIIESFEQVLLATLHNRIEYPDQDEKLKPGKELKGKEKNVEL